METEHTHQPESELDLDTWLATGERTTHNVNLYARMDLVAEIEELEAQIPADQREAPKAEDSLGGGSEDEFADLRQQIRGLEDRIHESKKVFRVTALTQQEILDLRREVEDQFSDEIEKAAAKGREEGKRTAKNLGATVPADINQMVRLGATKAVEELVERELSLAIIAKASSVTQNGQQLQLSVDHVRALYSKLGEAQIGLLSTAAKRANTQIPKVTPGK